MNRQQERGKMVQVKDASDMMPGQIVAQRYIGVTGDAGGIRIESSVRITVEGGAAPRSLWWFSDGRPVRIA